jgi:2-polyprenyl-3-methyl-5-hydroxy-6-metoxy-1,4-benzoquinol methylase
MNRKMRRANKTGLKRHPLKQSHSPVDPNFFSSFLEQGRLLLGSGSDEEATKIAIRAVRLQETQESKTFFVDCAKRWTYFPGADQIRDLIARALREPWGMPGELMGITKGIFDRDPAIGAAIQRATSAWPRRLSMNEFLSPDQLSKITIDPLLLAVLDSGKVIDVALERFLTSLRACLLQTVTQEEDHQGEDIVRFCCALARQCYTNEYVFDLTADENDCVRKLRARINEALNATAAIPPMAIAVLSSYISLDCLPTEALLKRAWPRYIVELLEEQIKTPAAEQGLRHSIPKITPIVDDTSIKVQNQYEQNPYPRWINMPTARPASIDEIIPQYFPFSNYRKIGKGTELDVLIAGCGTGLHSLKFAQIFPDAKILAIDLSMPSLCYAKEKTRKMGFDNIEYAQADILEIGGIDRRFDVISSSGVLHHLANPEQGWSTLLSLLRPGGCMNIGLYSERARRNLVIAQRWLVERGFTPSVEDIRRARQELIARANINDSMNDVRKFADFYSTSECRDLLFHAQEHQYTIPAIHEFLEKNNLEFLGFMIGNEILDHFRKQFSKRAESNLDLWNSFETQQPDTFKTMYEFWVQKRHGQSQR